MPTDNSFTGLLRRLFGKNKLTETASSTTLYDIPLEVLDIILQKSYLHCILNSPTKQRDKDVIRSLISVDVCFNRRITRRRFKKQTFRYLKDFYRKNKKVSAMIGNNAKFLLQNIQPNDELLTSLISVSCLTEEQSHFIQRQHSERDKNDELLRIVRSMDKIKYSDFIRCLRGTNQETAAKILANGGVAIKVSLKSRNTKSIASMEMQQLHQSIEDLRNRAIPLSHQTDILISQLKDEGVEILNSQLDRQTVIIWIWCRTQSALIYIQWLYESNQLNGKLSAIFDSINSTTIHIEKNQFKKTVVDFMISINFGQRIDVEIDEEMCGVTKLGNKIYVLYRPQRLLAVRRIIRVFEDRNPFRPQKNIKINLIIDPEDIGSSQKENCLYISDLINDCIWKITIKADERHQVIIWLSINYEPRALSVSSDGQLLVIDHTSSILNIYGSDAELIRSIQLAKDYLKPIHTVKTSIGHFIIIYHSVDKTQSLIGLYELTEDGQTILRRYKPSNETQTLHNPRYLTLDSDDRVFVADCWMNKSRVILIDSDLNWDQIICPTKQREEIWIDEPRRLHYDEEKQELIVGGYRGSLNVYTFIRN